MAVRMSYPLVEIQLAALQEERDPQLARQAIPANLLMLEGFLKADPTNLNLLDLLAEGFCSYSFSYVEDKENKRASELYLRGRDYAVRALDAQGSKKHLLDLDTASFQAGLQAFGKEAVPSLFWLGQCWGGWVNLNLDKMEAIGNISRVGWVMERVLELDFNYHYAGPHLFLGTFYGNRSKLLGGNPEKSLRHFQENQKLTESKFLMSYLLQAKTYAVQIQDRELFERLLKRVLDTPSDILPQQRLANEIAKVKAEYLLERADDLF